MLKIQMKMILNLKNFNLKNVKALYFCCHSPTEKTAMFTVQL
jgi:hypothetical protein